MIVVDLGCANHGVDSVSYLLERFHPDTLYGFDPWPELQERDYTEQGAHIEIRRKAAWTHDGQAAYTVAGTGSHVGSGGLSVACFDFAGWLATLSGELVVKIDAEGAEYPLLERLIATGTDAAIALLLIEWHDGDQGLPPRLACPVEAWTL